MASELLDIQPQELKFTFELRKQSSCSIQLLNKSRHYVAFKVKTTSPRSYCVIPNIGVIVPKTTCEFTVTMQAQKIAPPDLQCKDKFLVQSTVVPFGSTEEDLKPNLFSKENGRFIEENKLRVILVSPPHSPILQPINGALNQGSTSEALVLKESPLSKESPRLREAPLSNGTHKARDRETSAPTGVPCGIENLHPSYVAENTAVMSLKAKLLQLESKLSEAEKSMLQLSDEKSSAIQEREKLQRELVILRRKYAAGARVGFPFLFVCFVALVGVTLGYLIHP